MHEREKVAARSRKENTNPCRQTLALSEFLSSANQHLVFVLDLLTSSRVYLHLPLHIHPSPTLSMSDHRQYQIHINICAHSYPLTFYIKKTHTRRPALETNGRKKSRQHTPATESTPHETAPSPRRKDGQPSAGSTASHSHPLSHYKTCPDRLVANI